MVGLPMPQAGGGTHAQRGFWEMVLSRSTSHGKLRGMLNNWLPDPEPLSQRFGSRTELKSKLQGPEEPDEWRRVVEIRIDTDHHSEE